MSNWVSDDVRFRSYLKRHLPKGVKFARLHAQAINLDAYGMIQAVVNKTDESTKKAGIIAYGIKPGETWDGQDVSAHDKLFSFIVLDFDGSLDVANGVVDCVVDFAERQGR